jgi:hypothetical protein
MRNIYGWTLRRVHEEETHKTGYINLYRFSQLSCYRGIIQKHPTTGRPTVIVSDFGCPSSSSSHSRACSYITYMAKHIVVFTRKMHINWNLSRYVLQATTVTGSLYYSQTASLRMQCLCRACTCTRGAVPAVHERVARASSRCMGREG